MEIDWDVWTWDEKPPQYRLVGVYRTFSATEALALAAAAGSPHPLFVDEEQVDGLLHNI